MPHDGTGMTVEYHCDYLLLLLRLLLRLRPPFRGGTFLPFLRASERPMAIACLRLFTFLPLLPLLSLPRLRLRIARSTSFEALREYRRAIIRLPIDPSWFSTGSAARLTASRLEQQTRAVICSSVRLTRAAKW